MRKVYLSMFIVMSLVVLAACGGNKVDDAAAEKYIAKAEETVSLLNEGKGEEVHALFDDEMKSALPADQLGEVISIVEQSGAFEKIEKSSVEEKDGYHVVVLVAKYSEEKRVYTISLNDKEEVAGLFIK